MIVVRGWSITVIVLVFLTTAIWAQDPAATSAPAAPGGPSDAPAAEEKGVGGAAEDEANGFIVPQRFHDDADIFGYGSVEYVAVSRKRRFRTASLICKMEFNGKLAILDDNKKAMFMAEALSETNLNMDALWISGKKKENTTDGWVWLDGNETSPVSPDIIKTLSQVKPVNATDRDCLAFARLDHDLPDYRELACHAERAMLCERPKGGGGGNSTHPGWIRLGKRLYKIFSEMVPYDKAAERCFQNDHEAQLAVIINFNYSQLLGRYLLIGRPSLENAWIGAKWIENRYTFEPEPIPLSNETVIDDKGHYPPWRKDRIQKVGGCVLLDRHLTNITLFVEARCERERGYICYKLISNLTTNESYSDVIIKENGYRIHFNKRPWKLARDFCKTAYNKYNSYLAEIPSIDIKTELLYVMGENRTAIQHIWIGASMGNDSKGWIWDKTQSAVNLDILDWVKNSTYNEEAEQGNVCLNMDRENHIAALHYGANCDAHQVFVCAFTKADLQKLEEEERRREIERLRD